MAAFSRDQVTQVLAAVDIVEVIGAHVQLKPAGAGRFTGLCPFHHEKTPSFSVSRERQQFYCFGCEKGGDAIAFLREHEGLDFVEAVRALAERAGVHLVESAVRSHDSDPMRSKLFELAKFARQYFRETLEDPLRGGKGRTYLKSRALRPETVKRFTLGYAPGGYDAFINAAHAKGFDDKTLLASGLARAGERGGLYAFFRDRLMFPITDVPGKVVAFGGRDLTGEAKGKYVNSSESPIYKKGRVLYGLYEARESLRKEKRAILVEGYFDLLRCVDAGFENAVATCGTALTLEQAKLILRYAREVIVVYDGDEAGIRAALRGIGILVAAGLTVRALALPDGQDPDDFILASGADAFRKRLEEAPGFVDFFVRMNESRLGSIEGRREVADELFAVLKGMDDELRRDEYLKLMAQRLELDPFKLAAEYRRFAQKKEAWSPPTAAKTAGPATVRPLHENLEDALFLAYLLNREPLIESARRELAGFTLPDTPLAEVIRALFDAGPAHAAARLESEEAKALFAAAANLKADDPELGEALVSKRALSLRREILRADAQRIAEELRAADRAKNWELGRDLLAQQARIRQEIERIGAV